MFRVWEALSEEMGAYISVWRTRVLWPEFPLPWDGGVDKRPRSLRVDKERQVNRYLRPPPPPDVRSECARNQKLVERGTGHEENGHRRETCMGVGDLLGQEEAVAGHGVFGIVVRLREDARCTQPGIRRHSERNLVRLQVLACKGASAQREERGLSEQRGNRVADPHR